MSGAPARAAPAEGLHYKPPAEADDERPVITSASGAVQGGNYALALTFDRPPADPSCKNACANATLLLDMDNNRTTGLNLGKGAVETGADLKLTLQSEHAHGATPYLKVRLWLVDPGSDGSTEGTSLADFDSRSDTEHVQVSEGHVYLVFDTTDVRIPRGKSVRLIYHPPAGAPAEGYAPGLDTGGKGKLRIVGAKAAKKRRSKP